jgi:hypothetical protein
MNADTASSPSNFCWASNLKAIPNQSHTLVLG